MALAGRPSTTRAGRDERTTAYREQETRTRLRLERLSRKRDTEHRLNVREALAERELARRYADIFGASTADGVPVFGIEDGIRGFDPSNDSGVLAHVNELLATVAFADVTSEYTPVDHAIGSRLLLVRNGRAIASLVALGTGEDGVPDGLLHVWVAGAHRRRGVARELVRAARARWPITHIVGPLNTQRAAARFAVKVAPDLPVLHLARSENVS